MENQGVRACSRLLLWGLLFSFWYGLPACSKGAIQGRVFLDENNNGMIDFSETGAPFAKVVVYKDKQIIASGLTRQDGSFTLSTKGGTYFFQVDMTGYDLDLARRQAATMTIGENDSKAFEFKAQEATPTEETGDPVNGTPEDDGGYDGAEYPAEDVPPAGGSSGSSGENSKGKCDPDGWTDQGYLACAKRGETKLVQIPVVIDNVGALDRVLDAPKKNCIIGAPCTISVARLSGCSVDVVLPDQAVVADQSGITFNQSLGVAKIEPSTTSHATLSAMKAAGTQQQAQRATLQPSLSVAELSFTAPTSLPDAAFEFTAKPVMWCGDTRYDLKERQISFTRDIVASVRVAVTDTVNKNKLKVTLVSDGASPIEEGQVVLTLTTDNLPMTVSNAGSCDNLGQAMLCTIREPIVRGVNQGERSWNVTLITPAASEDDTTITATVKFQSRYLEAAVEGIPATLFFPATPAEPVP